MSVFVEEGKPENLDKTIVAAGTSRLNPHMAPGKNETRATLVGSGCSHDCRPNPARQWKESSLVTSQDSSRNKDNGTSLR